MEDAVSAGLIDMVRVIDNGHSAPGTILKDCSASFQKEFYESDLIISKGQANFETLSEIEEKTFFLLQAKCISIANFIGCKHLDYVLISNL